MSARRALTGRGLIGRIRLCTAVSTTALVCALTFSACTTGLSGAGVSATPTPVEVTPTILKFDAAASEQENLALFDSVAAGVIAKNANAVGRDFIDALVSAGFPKGQLAVTPDRTTVDLEADSIQFAMNFAGTCLIGQYGKASAGYHSFVAPQLGTGKCFIGNTRPIDW